MKGATIVLTFVLVIAVGSACASTQPITDPIEVIQAFHDALNSGNLDEAMSYVADDAKFVLYDVHSGKAQVRDFYQGEVGRNIHYELNDLKLEGDRVTGNLHGTSDQRGFDASIEAVVEGGKIVSYAGL